jgi:hypothetical protein
VFLYDPYEVDNQYPLDPFRQRIKAQKHSHIFSSPSTQTPNPQLQHVSSVHPSLLQRVVPPLLLPLFRKVLQRCYPTDPLRLRLLQYCSFICNALRSGLFQRTAVRSAPLGRTSPNPSSSFLGNDPESRAVIFRYRLGPSTSIEFDAALTAEYLASNFAYLSYHTAEIDVSPLIFTFLTPMYQNFSLSFTLFLRSWRIHSVKTWRSSRLFCCPTTSSSSASIPLRHTMSLCSLRSQVADLCERPQRPCCRQHAQHDR